MYGFSYEMGGLIITVCEKEGKISRISVGHGTFPFEGEVRETKTIRECGRQLKEYFLGKRKDFDIPLYMEGTPFQMRVWEVLKKIPYGETRTYGQIAAEAGNPKAARAVGGANNKNPIGIIVPCHRVIGANGSLIGYAAGTDIKNYLLKLEKKNK